MEFRENADKLLSQVRIKEDLHRRIMEGKELNRKKKAVWKRAAVPVAAAALIMSTMYVGAGYLMEHTPIRELFTARDKTALPVPEEQYRPDIYGEIMDPTVSARVNPAASGADQFASGKAAMGDAAEERTGVRGEKIIDNDLFSVELVEMTCVGRELSFGYILTQKKEGNLTVDVWVDSDYRKQWQEAGGEGPYDSDKNLMRHGSGDSFAWNKIPAEYGYRLAENQTLCIKTQLGKQEYVSGTYTLYAESYFDTYEPAQGNSSEENLEVILPEHSSGTEKENFQVYTVPEEEVERSLFCTPIEITGNENYGLSLCGATDKAEGEVHFDEYDMYVSPMTVYLTLNGTYQGEMSEVWGMHSSHDIVIGFRDGTETRTTVLLSSMGYGKGELEVDMQASFDTIIDPEAITRVVLDEVVIMGDM